jgi:hypothetical protein
MGRKLVDKIRAHHQLPSGKLGHRSAKVYQQFAFDNKLATPEEFKARSIQEKTQRALSKKEHHKNKLPAGAKVSNNQAADSASLLSDLYKERIRRAFVSGMSE